MFFRVGDDAVSNMVMYIIALCDRILIISRSVSPDYWSERSVVDVPAGRDVPPVDRSHHAVEDKRPENDIFHTSYLSRAPRACSCKFFLAGVNFYRFNAKNWLFTV